MKIKTSELTGAALDWAVAKCEGITVLPKMRGGCYVTLKKGETVLLCYSTDWSQGGPIIEREELSRLRCYGTNEWECLTGEVVCEGSTPLIAAMRCYVASKLGDEIEIPEELTQGQPT
jgi:hypothetical protein